MITVSATEFSKNFERYLNLAQREPVAVTSHERVIGYFIGPAEYEEFLRAKSALPKSFAVEELSEDTIKALDQAVMEVRHNRLNTLLEE